MSEATSKQWRGFVSNNNPTMDALVPTCKNKIQETTILMPDNEPYEYRLYHIIGAEVPDNTLYPDTLAPIGSTYLRLILTNGVVTGALMYLKTAAATWTAQS
jgi:hypothetical protein